MNLVPAICPQCGGQIEVDKTQEAAVCKYCGTPFIVEKAINIYSTTVTNNNSFEGATINVSGANIENLLKLANNALEAGNGEEAINFCNKALEIEPEKSEAWYIKMRSVEHSSTVADPKINETISYGKNAIEYADNDEKQNIKSKVYKYYLSRANTLLLIAISKMKDTEKIKSIAGLGMSAMQGAAKGDVTTRTLYLNLGESALKLKTEIPIDSIASDEDIQKNIVALAKLYGSLCEADAERIKIYGQSLAESAISARKKSFEKFKEGLPEDKKAALSDDKVSSNNGGCYIATCVYGSYDCPPVWTLRRYRDFQLSKKWYGRLFIKCYYKTSPTIVKLFGNNSMFRLFWRKKLDRMTIKLQNKGFESTPYSDINW